MIVGTRTVWPIARHDASTEVGGGRAKTRAVLTGSRKSIIEIMSRTMSECSSGAAARARIIS